MTEQEKKEHEKKLAEEAAKLSEIDIAELANKELRKKEAENERLRKELAQAKLYSVADDGEVETRSREDVIKVISDSTTNNYDYAEAVVELVDIELEKGNANPLGSNGKEVYDFFKECLEECGNDKSRFASVYQSKIGQDDPQIAMAYNNRKN